jgi:hypothetical protein
MPAELREGTTLKRLIKIHSLSEPVEVGIEREGISVRVRGSRKKLFASWHQVVLAAQTPVDVPSFLAGRPIEFLKHALSKRTT